MVDELRETKRVMGALLRMPPQQHTEMKIGKPQKAAAKKTAKKRTLRPAK